jgi:mannose-6-phosphate isomerase-like protein (cupin superfamily)
MAYMRKDEILERLVFSDELIEAYARPERDSTEPASDHWPGPVLLERVAYLRKLAHFGEGSASETIREFPGYNISLMALLRSGEAVVDEEHGLTFLVLDGRAALVSGGAVERARRVTTSELRGAAITGGEIREVRRGDIVHLAAGTPHQILISGDGRLAVLVTRVQQERGRS